MTSPNVSSKFMCLWALYGLKVAEKLTVDGILENWEHGIKPMVMEEWGEHNKDELVELFGQVRDEWISSDIHGWIAANRYEGLKCLYLNHHCVHAAEIPDDCKANDIQSDQDLFW